MAHVNLAIGKHLLDRFGQVQQAQQISRRRTAATDSLGSLLMGIAEFFYETAHAGGFFHSVQIFALHIFDKRHGKRALIIDFSNDGGNCLFASQLACTVAAFAGDNLIPTACKRSNDDRTDYALLTN